jgi:hypothetical protein
MINRGQERNKNRQYMGKIKDGNKKKERKDNEIKMRKETILGISTIKGGGVLHVNKSIVSSVYVYLEGSITHHPVICEDTTPDLMMICWKFSRECG